MKLKVKVKISQPAALGEKGNILASLFHFILLFFFIEERTRLLHFKVAVVWSEKESEQGLTSHWLITSRVQFNIWTSKYAACKSHTSRPRFPTAFQGQTESLGTLFVCWTHLKTFTLFLPKQSGEVILLSGSVRGNVFKHRRPRQTKPCIKV